MPLHKIEHKVGVPRRHDQRRSESFHTFLLTLRKLEVGQSFACPDVTSNHRIVLAAAPTLLQRRFYAYKEHDHWRVGRTA